MTAIAGALGSVIGYVGAEVAEVTLFERLLWPQRFYNHLSLLSFLKISFLMPMGGPLHRAALETLDHFREHGLYRGPCMGHMLGSAFFAEKEFVYFNRSSGGAYEGKAVRNGFWVEVLKLIDQNKVARLRRITSGKTSGWDVEVQGPSPVRRAHQLVFLLRITTDNSNTSGNQKATHHAVSLEVCEERVTWQVVLGVLASELTTVAFGIAVGIWQKVFWLTSMLCVPLLLKLLMLLASVRREGVLPEVLTNSLQSPVATDKATLKAEPTLGYRNMPESMAATALDSSKQASNETHILTIPTELFEIICPRLGFILVEAPAAHVSPFFRHYGHPIRLTYLDRVREICCISFIYAFVLYFPAGLVALLWMDPNVQYFWLGYQAYAIIAMHVTRLFGYSGCGRTEERVAQILQQGKKVCLRSGKSRIYAQLEIEKVISIAAGRQRVADITEEHTKANGKV